VPLVLARGLLLRHEVVALLRWLKGKRQTAGSKQQGKAAA
jgi:hypothetical protein